MSRRWRWFPLVVGSLLALAAVGFIPVSLPLADPTIIPSHNRNEPVGGIYRDNDAAQQFLANGDAISSVSLFLATYGRENPGSFQVVVEAQQAERWVVLRTYERPKDEIRDNAFYTAKFSPAVAVRPGQNVRVHLQADGTASQAISWYVNPQWAQPGDELSRNDQPHGGGAVLNVAYGQRSGTVFSLLREAWPRATPLLAPVWQAVFVLASVGAVGAFIALTARTMGRDE